MAPSMPLVAALFRLSAADIQEDTGLLQMPAQDVIWQADAGDSDANDAAHSACVCPGYYEDDCRAHEEQGCTWTNEGDSNAPWCQCDQERWQAWRESGEVRQTFPPGSVSPVAAPPGAAGGGAQASAEIVIPAQVLDVTIQGFSVGTYRDGVFEARPNECGGLDHILDPPPKSCDGNGGCRRFILCWDSGYRGWDSQDGPKDVPGSPCAGNTCEYLRQFWAYDFDEPVNVAEYRWITTAYTCASAWTVQYSEDGSTWTDAASESGQGCGSWSWDTYEGEWQSWSTGTDATARHWRWAVEQVTGGGNLWAVEFNSIEMIGSSSPSTPAVSHAQGVAGEALASAEIAIPDPSTVNVLVVGYQTNDGWLGEVNQMLHSFGYSTTVVDDSELVSGFDYTPYDIVSLNYDVNIPNIQDLFAASEAGTIGIALHYGTDSTFAEFFGGGTAGGQWVQDGAIRIEDANHYITEQFVASEVVPLYTGSGYTSKMSHPTANARVLAVSDSHNGPALVVHNTHKRAVLPFYGHGSLNTDVTIMQRTYEWLLPNVLPH